MRAARANARAGAGRGAATRSAQLKRNQDLRRRRASCRRRRSTPRRRAPIARPPASPARRRPSTRREANARNAQVAVDYTLIRAPFDGVILSKSANVGDMVTPFSIAPDSKGAVVTMADMSTLEVEADVSESSLAKVKVGQPAEIVLDALPDARFRGRISRMVPTVDRAKATVMTKVQVRRDRPAHPAGDEREGELPVAGRDAGAAEAAARRAARRDRRSATGARSCSSCATARRSRCR